MLRRSSSRLLGHLAAGARSQGYLSAVADAAAPSTSFSSDDTSSSSTWKPLSSTQLAAPSSYHSFQQRNTFFSWGGGRSSGAQQEDAAATVLAADGQAPEPEPFIEVPFEPSAADIVQEASEILDASAAADVAAFAAAHVGRWWNVSAFMDLLGSAHYSMGLPWCVATAAPAATILPP
jgi:hypothetical protein